MYKHSRKLSRPDSEISMKGAKVDNFIFFSHEVTDLNSLSTVGDGGVDRKVSVHETHLVAVALRDAVDQVGDVAERRADSCGGFPAAEPGVYLQLLLPRGLVGDELEIEVQVLEIARELAPGTLDHDHLRIHLDLHAVGDIHGVGGENRLHFRCRWSFAPVVPVRGEKELLLNTLIMSRV
ncbi:phosphoenolpyruvate carboxykinase [Striga asiatica]|uniref:Phosphoenolpyruvate carboxykinase n=1 Tax=Striga asiatica TaxID=4170 RepID=A0A5A7QPD8_STRAF|nr:phosphoenolpyruvate carboxykinase [Striga asiatica]